MLEDSSIAAVDVQGVPVPVCGVSTGQGGDSSRVGAPGRHNMGLSVVPYLSAGGGILCGTGVLEVYRHDLVVRRFAGETGACRSRRGMISGISPRSADRLRFQAHNYPGEWLAWIDLTLPGENWATDWREVERYRHNWFCRLRRSHPGIAYLWVKELQQRGALHFHILSSVRVEKDWLSRSWWEVVGSGEESHLRCGTRVERVKSRDAACCYIGKYLSKVEQKQGRNGRWWGASRELVTPLWSAVGDGERIEQFEAYVMWRKEQELGRPVHLFQGGAGGVVYGGAQWAEEEAAAAGLERL